MKIVFVRHGDARAGFRGPIGGPIGCSGLTDLGRAQADLLRRRLAASHDVHVLVTSEIPRAIETAGIIAPALGLGAPGRDCDLCEVHTGTADGVDWSEYPRRFGSFDMVSEPDRVFAPHGDSWNSFHRRVDEVMHRLAEDHPRQNVMAVCHAGVIAASLRVRLGAPLHARTAEMRPAHTGLTTWEFDEAMARWTLHSYNDVAHLSE